MRHHLTHGTTLLLLVALLAGCGSTAMEPTPDASPDAIDAARTDAPSPGTDATDRDAPAALDAAPEASAPEASVPDVVVPDHDSATSPPTAPPCDCTAACVPRACATACRLSTGARDCPVTHVFDLATQMPEHLAVMYSMSWFGIPSTGDPDGPGSDRGWGNWRWGGGCVPVNDPTTCSSTPAGSPQRVIASRHRPLAGIYSSTGRDAESQRRIDLMLSTLRRPCDAGARIDAWSVQLDSIKFSSRYLATSDPHYADSADIAYRAYLAFLARADAAGMSSVILPGIDSTWYWNFGADRGLTTQALRLGALEDDLVDMVLIGWTHDSIARIDGRPIVYAYTGGNASGPFIAASEWVTLLGHVRNRTGLDVYAVGGAGDPTYFTAFDAMSPWLASDVWNATSGATVYDHAVAWTHHRIDSLLAHVDSYPGRVVWGGVSPGFDDYTKDWGTCTERVVPRDDALLDAQFDVMTAARPTHAIRGMLFETWDDWTEGSLFEPEVGVGTDKLVHLRGLLGRYFGDPVDTAGDTALDARWTSYGQARNCSGAAHASPTIDLRCP